MEPYEERLTPSEDVHGLSMMFARPLWLVQAASYINVVAGNASIDPAIHTSMSASDVASVKAAVEQYNALSSKEKYEGNVFPPVQRREGKSNQEEVECHPDYTVEYYWWGRRWWLSHCVIELINAGCTLAALVPDFGLASVLEMTTVNDMATLSPSRSVYLYEVLVCPPPYAIWIGPGA